MKVEPNIVVETSKDRFHLYFRVKCEVGEFKQYAPAITKALGGDTQACDIAHVFRIAGTINWKSEPVVAKLRRCRKSTPIPIKELATELGVTLQADQKNEPSPTTGIQRGPSKDKVQKLLDRIPADERRVWLHVGMALHDWSPNEGRILWEEWSQKSNKFDKSDQEKTWRGFRSGGRTIRTLYFYAKEFSSTTDGKRETRLPVEENELVRYLADVLINKLRIVDEDQYFVFGPHHWHRDNKAAARLILHVIEDLRQVAAASEYEYASGKLKAFGNYVAAQRLMRGLLAFAKFDAKLEDFDANPALLGVKNGVIDLRKGKFRDGRPADMITLAAPTSYCAEAQCPRFKEFLKSVMEDKEYRAYFQRLCGYWLIGDAREQLGFILLGKGSNGKGTITRLTETVLGRQYVATLSPAFVRNASHGNPNGPTPALMTLQKARLIWCTESEKKRGVDPVFFKQLTGSDTLTGRHNYGEQQSFHSPGKFVLTTNEMPDWPHEDEALWRRVKVLPFTKQFNHENGRNNNLDAELASEAEGILNWMIEGAKRYSAHDLGSCKAVDKATASARKKSDTVWHWFIVECKRDGKSSLGASDAYDAYEAFTRQQRFQCVTRPVFKKNMERLGFHQHRVSARIIYQGLKFRR